MQIRLALSFFALLAGTTTAQDVSVVVERNASLAASTDYKFATVPAISESDAGNLATAKLVRGSSDTNGGSVRTLFDGRGSENQDDPKNNFFLAGTDGAQLLIDLGREIDIRQFNTYSWHPSLRGPQVYTLYGICQPAETGAEPTIFDMPTVSGIPAGASWKKIADVDTRINFADAGGQYGVSIRGADEQPLGTYRYLVVDISSTAPGRFNSQSFFSEIDIVDGKSYEKAPTETQIDVLDVDGKYQITFDTSEVPELRGWVDQTLKPICLQWYPKIVELLPSEDYEAPKAFTIYFHRDMSGVANASGTRINCASRWFLQNLNGEAPGSVVHEMVHIVQQYRGRRGRNRNPGWMVEGVADYVRWFLYEPQENRPQPNPRRSNFDDSYRTTAAFLNYVVDKYDAQLVQKMNAAMRQGKYSDALWTEFTGKTPPELWDEFAATLPQRR